ncbi:MAG: GNAT family N-acetyltransferase [Pirellulaceae bacterium]|nr:GNAT family N-acetyltransferase [Pirellulaceae bacterium]
MPHITTTACTPIRDSFKVEQVRGMFDLPRVPREKLTFAAELPDEDEDWTIGAIVGPSGSGKSTLARAAFGTAVHQPAEWSKDGAVIDAFAGLPIKHVAQLLTSVGLGSPLAWLRPYHVLSGGEKFRCELARAITKEPAGLVVFDEFTSVVDRTVAKCASAALARLVRKWQRVRFVAVTCHYDVLEWLAPDWHLDTATGHLARGSLQRNPIRLQVRRCPQSMWPLFARHHYLSGGLSRAATCYIALWEGRPVAFCAALAQLGHRGRKRISRLVTLPDYQGLGIGLRLAERVCEDQTARGFRISITTSHPAIIACCRSSPLWRPAGIKRLGGTRQRVEGRNVAGSTGRGVASFEWREGRGQENGFEI